MRNLLVALAALSATACATNAARNPSLEEVGARAAPAAAPAPAPAVAREDAPAAPTQPLPCTLTRVHFAFDSTLLDAEARDALGGTARCIAQKKIPDVVIEGHADERGTEAYNIALGQRRAEAVRGFLQKLGVASKTEAVSFGEAYPVEQGSSERAWAANRRAELRAPGEKLSDGVRVVPGA
jgi:peptidoglycan-associated lipoprotein